MSNWVLMSRTLPFHSPGTSDSKRQMSIYQEVLVGFLSMTKGNGISVNRSLFR